MLRVSGGAMLVRSRRIVGAEVRVVRPLLSAVPARGRWMCSRPCWGKPHSLDGATVKEDASGRIFKIWNAQWQVGGL